MQIELSDLRLQVDGTSHLQDTLLEIYQLLCLFMFFKRVRHIKYTLVKENIYKHKIIK